MRFAGWCPLLLLGLATCGSSAAMRPGQSASEEDAGDVEPPPARDTAVQGTVDATVVNALDVMESDDEAVVESDGASAAPDAQPSSDDVAPPPAGVFENSLGMRFVAVPGVKGKFSIWETRVRDFEAYAMATGATVPHPEFPELPLQPKASVSRKEAESFAAWLTKKEQGEKKIGATAQYRLPTDAEWDLAIEVGKTGGPFPWGSGFPPPDHFANYGVTKDGFTYTAPVGSFPANKLGLYDMAGNLWEWIGEGCSAGKAYLVRGAGWNAHNQSFFNLDFHYCFGGDLVGHHNVGFRLVLADPGG